MSYGIRRHSHVCNYLWMYPHVPTNSRVVWCCTTRPAKRLIFRVVQCCTTRKISQHVSSCSFNCATLCKLAQRGTLHSWISVLHKITQCRKHEPPLKVRLHWSCRNVSSCTTRHIYTIYLLHCAGLHNAEKSDSIDQDTMSIIPCCVDVHNVADHYWNMPHCVNLHNMVSKRYKYVCNIVLYVVSIAGIEMPICAKEIRHNSINFSFGWPQQCVVHSCKLSSCSIHGRIVIF